MVRNSRNPGRVENKKRQTPHQLPCTRIQTCQTCVRGFGSDQCSASWRHESIRSSSHASRAFAVRVALWSSLEDERRCRATSASQVLQIGKPEGLCRKEHIAAQCRASTACSANGHAPAALMGEAQECSAMPADRHAIAPIDSRAQRHTCSTQSIPTQPYTGSCTLACASYSKEATASSR